MNLKEPLKGDVKASKGCIKVKGRRKHAVVKHHFNVRRTVDCRGVRKLTTQAVQMGEETWQF